MYKIIIASMFIGGFSVFVQAASFDCNKAATATEKLICSDEKVSILDEQLATVYQAVNEAAADKNILKVQQRDWLKQKRNACADVTCLAQAYHEKIAALNSLLGGGSSSEYSIQKKSQYKLLPFEDNPSLEDKSGVCKDFLKILNSTPYETLVNDIFLNILKGRSDFEPLNWQYVDGGDERFGKIIEQKIILDEKSKNPEERIDAFRAHNQKHGGLDYYISEAMVFQGYENQMMLPILLFSEKSFIYPSERKSWSSIFLTSDTKNYYSGGGIGDSFISWSHLRNKQIFKYKNKYFSISSKAKNSFAIGRLNSELYSLCKYTLIK